MAATDAVAKKPSNLPSFRREVSFWFYWLFGTAVTTVGIISFVQIAFGIHLVPAYAHGLAVYRDVVHSVFGTLYVPFVYFIERVASWFHFSLRITIPGWWKDLATISTINMMAFFRGFVIAGRDLEPGSEPKKDLLDTARAAEVILAFLVAGVMLFGLILPLLVLWATKRNYRVLMEPERGPDPVRMMVTIVASLRRAYPLSWLAIAIAAVIFFVTNAYQL
jgi:hypothetical protein